MDSRKKFFHYLTLTLLGLSLAAAPHARAADDDLPAPSSGTSMDEVPTAEPPPQADMPEPLTGDAMPAPAAGTEDTLPPPSVNAGAKDDAVNHKSEADDIFLPSAEVQDNVNYTPVGAAPNAVRSATDEDWRIGTTNRPAFLLGFGPAMRNYQDNRTTKTPGVMLGASWRIFNIAQTVFLHAYGAASVYKIGAVGTYGNVIDTTFHYGLMLEIGIGRRLSLFGSLLHRNSNLTADPAAPGVTQNIADLALVHSPASIQMGAGLQWDFYVIPHGSVGARVQIEKDLAMALLTVAVEPAPRKKLNLNYEQLE